MVIHGHPDPDQHLDQHGQRTGQTTVNRVLDSL
jgi:hypothetical protein